MKKLTCIYAATLAVSVLLLFIQAGCSPDQNVELVYHDIQNFPRFGQLPGISDYSRLPLSAKDSVRPEIWLLSQRPSGISVEFITNANKIGLTYELGSDKDYHNMTPIATHGFDLYVKDDSLWRFVGVLSNGTIIDGIDDHERHFRLNFPLFNQVTKVELGIPAGSEIKAVKKTDTNPVVAYGTSITQGASASRPGLAYTSKLSRALNREVINLGFSGNGFFEKELGPFIMSCKPSFVILDCTTNSLPDTISRNAPELIKYIRSIDATVPILLVESIVNENAHIKSSVFRKVTLQNERLHHVYDSLHDPNVKYIFAADIFTGHDNTIDGLHLNDVGMDKLHKAICAQIKGK